VARRPSRLALLETSRQRCLGGLRAACRSAWMRWAEPNRRVVSAEVADERPQQRFSETHPRCALTDMALESAYRFRWRRAPPCATGSEVQSAGVKPSLRYWPATLITKSSSGDAAFSRASNFSMVGTASPRSYRA